MKTSLLHNRMGRLFRPPIFNFPKAAYFPILGICLLATSLFSIQENAGAQVKRVRKVSIQNIPKQGRIVRAHPGVLPRNEGAAATESKQSQKQIRQLLKQMLRPSADYSGSENTWLSNANGGIQSQQEIRGDTKGRVVRLFLTPPLLKGDVMLTGRGTYLYYHAKQKTVEREGASPESQFETSIQNGMANHSVKIQITGHQLVAERDATILVVSAPSGGVTLWLDTATGIKLSHEIRDSKGNPISRSWMTKIVVGAEAGVAESDFHSREIDAATPSDLKENFKSIAEAKEKSGILYTPRVPTTLPPGFEFKRITILTPQNSKGAPKVAILHFSDGVTNFTLQERPILRPRQSPPEDLTKRPNRWRIQIPGGELEVNFRGRLLPEQVLALHESLK